jgi:hypothetical protein
MNKDYGELDGKVRGVCGIPGPALGPGPGFKIFLKYYLTDKYDHVSSI